MLLHQIAPAPQFTISPSATRAHRISTLPILLLNIHTRCNCRCVMCDIWRRKIGSEISAASLERHRESLKNLRVRQVVLSGGEPLLNRDLEAICAFFRGLHIRITLLTTGLLLHERSHLVASMIDDVILSLDGPPEIHNAIRRVPRAFQTIAQGVRSLRAIRPDMPISCRTTIQKQNHTQLRATAAAARTLGLDSISFLPADLYSAAFNRDQPWHAERQDEIALDATELLALEREVELLIALYQADSLMNFIAEDESKLRRLTNRFREHLEHTPPQAPECNAPWVSAVMEVDGQVRPCFFHASVASTEIATLEAALNSHQAITFRNSLSVASNPTCQRCVCSLNYKPTESAS